MTPPRRPEVWPPYKLPFPVFAGAGFIPPGTCAPPAGRRGRRPLHPSGEQAMTASPALRSPVHLTRRGGIHPSRDMCAACGASGTPPPTTIRGAGNDGKAPRRGVGTPPYVLPFPVFVGEGFIPPGTCAPPAGRRGRRPLQPSGEQAMTARPRPTSPAKAHTAVILPLRAPSPIPDIPPRWP